MTKNDTNSTERRNMIGSAEHRRADGKAGADIRPRIGFADLREWMVEARKLG